MTKTFEVARWKSLLIYDIVIILASGALVETWKGTAFEASMIPTLSHEAP